MNHSREDFGSYIEAVTERDMDLLLLEEFHVNNAFVAWFCSNLGLGGIIFDGAWHSVCDTDGETDLLLRVLKDGRRIGIFIEDKIGAPEQDQQDERYHVRANKCREAGKFHEYVTVICAPQYYLDGLCSKSGYQYRVAYEAIAAWFGKQEGCSADRRRADWRGRIVQEAIAQGRRGYVMKPSTVTTAFHRDYWKQLHTKHPGFRMAYPKNRGPRSTWIIFKGHNFPPGVTINHKLEQQIIELGFAGHHIDEILAVRPEWPDDIALIQKGGTASLAISVPAIDMNLGFSAQLPSVEQALEAAERLVPFASLLEQAKAKASIEKAAHRSF